MTIGTALAIGIVIGIAVAYVATAMALGVWVGISEHLARREWRRRQRLADQDRPPVAITGRPRRAGR